MANKVISSTKNKPIMNLRQLNFVAAALLIIQGLLILFMSSPSNGARPIATQFLSQDKLASAASGHGVMAQASRHLFDLNLAHVVAAFLLLGGLSFIVSVTKYRHIYESDLKAGKNRVRWFGFAASSALMMLAIALLAGIYNLTSLLMIMGLSVTAALLWLLKETVKPANWLNYWVGLGASALPWIIVLIYAWSAHVYGSSLSAFVNWIIVSILLLFAAFAVNFGFQSQKIGHWEDYIFGERVFIILSVITQSALAWQIYAGTLH